MAPSRGSAPSAWRRFAVCFVVLVAVDQAVIPVLHVSEARRYESEAQVRFENSDLFLVGPLTEYLQKRPIGQKRRVVFFGNSLVWGYLLDGQNAIPSVFQRLAPDVRVFNFAVNGFESGSAYLISKALIDSVDVYYLFHVGQRAHPLLAKLVPVSAEDAKRFRLETPSRFEQALDRLMGFWRLRRYAPRLQGAWFGTSTRQYLYLHKGEWVRRLLGRNQAAQAPTAQEMSPGLERAGWEASVAPRAVSKEDAARVAERYPLLWDYAQLLASHRKYGAIIEYVRQTYPMNDEDRRVFNAYFQPYVVVAKLTVPDTWFASDGRHFASAGTHAIAKMLYEHTADHFGLRSP